MLKKCWLQKEGWLCFVCYFSSLPYWRFNSEQLGLKYCTKMESFAKQCIFCGKGDETPLFGLFDFELEPSMHLKLLLQNLLEGLCHKSCLKLEIEWNAKLRDRQVQIAFPFQFSRDMQQCLFGLIGTRYPKKRNEEIHVYDDLSLSIPLPNYNQCLHLISNILEQRRLLKLECIKIGFMYVLSKGEGEKYRCLCREIRNDVCTGKLSSEIHI